MTARSRGRIRRALGLFHHYPSTRCDQVKAGKQSKNLRAHVVFEGSVDEDQVERLVRRAEFAERPPYIGHEDARTIGESELGEVGANRSRGVSR